MRIDYLDTRHASIICARNLTVVKKSMSSCLVKDDTVSSQFMSWHASAGCVIFEMACGYELTEVSPSKHDYESVKSEMIRDILIFIFRRNEQGRFLTTMEEV